MFCSKPDLAEEAKKGLKKLLANEVPIEIKPVTPAHFYRLGPEQPRRLFWGRARGHIGKISLSSCLVFEIRVRRMVHAKLFLLCVCVGEGNMKLHCCVAAYVSDFALLGTVLLPYPEYRAKFAASLDHSMWFHSTFRSDEWMLYECESPWAGQYVGHISRTNAEHSKAYVFNIRI